MVMLVCQAAIAQSWLKKAVSHLDELRVNLVLADKATTLSNFGCKDATIMSLLRALRAINSSSAKALTRGIVLKFGQEIAYGDCKKEEERTESWGRPSFKVGEGSMEPLTGTVAVRSMNQEVSHSVKRPGTPIFNIIRSPVRQTRKTTD